ncbi:hypothetical protein chiPu_0011402 [Chiloscyllium punctatum]|uniref:Uncharacterized protein n=1 Tax=Chiloscyllium punctatum TaxID=137246 RepID=A0A401SRC2_CHIPU|nr:hypothetical protein [Chiloscyllium punctatum]
MTPSVSQSVSQSPRSRHRLVSTVLDALTSDASRRWRHCACLRRRRREAGGEGGAIFTGFYFPLPFPHLLTTTFAESREKPGWTSTATSGQAAKPTEDSAHVVAAARTVTASRPDCDSFLA